jgi:hypothetical protein
MDRIIVERNSFPLGSTALEVPAIAAPGGVFWLLCLKLRECHFLHLMMMSVLVCVKACLTVIKAASAAMVDDVIRIFPIAY